MTHRMDLLAQLARKTDSKIVLLIMDGVGDIHTADSPRTPLERAETPNLDALAERAVLGLSLPAGAGVTPGSGPGHLALFGYDPLEEEHRIGRGVLEALGINYELGEGEIAARGNFVTLGDDGAIADRRAGRPSNEDCRRISKMLDEAIGVIDGIKVRVRPVKEHRFCVMFDGAGLDARLFDTDPQQTGMAPLPAKARVEDGAAQRTARIVQEFSDRARKILQAEPVINGLALRGFSRHPGLPGFKELYRLDARAIAAYPLYRGVACLAGMEVAESGPTPAEEFAAAAEHWNGHDFFFIHIKKTDSSGEDGDLDAKISVIEAVDAALPDLLALNPDVLCVTGDHSTPCPMKGHSWHPVPLLVQGPFCDVDSCTRFTETECLQGGLGRIDAADLMGLLLANAGKLAKFGA